MVLHRKEYIPQVMLTRNHWSQKLMNMVILQRKIRLRIGVLNCVCTWTNRLVYVYWCRILVSQKKVKKLTFVA